MEIFATIGNGRVKNQWTVVFTCCCGNLTIFICKIESDENGYALSGTSDKSSCFVDMFLHFSSSGVLLTEATINMFWKFLLVNSCEGVRFLKK